MLLARRLSTQGAFVVRDEVRAAVAARRPVVALESTIITHGMPFPRNLEVARACEAAVRERGAVPATVAVLAGAVRVGLADAELEAVAASGRAGAATKVSRRDLGWAVQRTRADPAACGATTVAATAWAARRAGVHVFATGGLGGVHRGASDTWDVSADLDELGRTQVLVVCGGVKSILDVPKTLEALETRGVAVAALGTRDFPAFFSLRSPGVDGAPNRAPLRVDSAAEAAAWFGAHRELGLASGCVLAVPNPAPLPTEAVEAATRDALAAARDAGVAGADATPFLLADLERRTAGRSLDANVALVLNNVAVAADVAAALTRPPRPPAVVVCGAAAVDVCATAAADTAGTSAPGVVRASRGGVGANVARAAARAAPTALLATTDASTLESLAEAGVDVRGCATAAAAPTYVALHGADGDLVGGVFASAAADAAAWDASAVAGARVVVVDANLSKDAYAAVLAALDDATELWFEPTSTAKAAAAFAEIRHRCDVVTPNEAELAALLRACGGAPVGFERDAAALAQRAGAAVIATRGARGAVLATRDGRVAALPAERVAAGLANGAGDAFCGAAAAARAAGRPLEEACRAGAAAAGRVVRGADPAPAVVF